MNKIDSTDVFGCCFTGYRPQKFPFPLSPGNPGYDQFENALTECLLNLAEENCRIFFTGMAMGFDIIAAETVLMLKKTMAADIRLVCVLPFAGQGDSFPVEWKKRFYDLLDSADRVEILSEKYYGGCYQARNKYLVDHSDFVVSWYDGKAGGTRNTLNYALKIGRKVQNLYRETVEGFGYQIPML